MEGMIEIKDHHFESPRKKITDLGDNHQWMNFEWKLKYDYECFVPLPKYACAPLPKYACPFTYIYT